MLYRAMMRFEVELKKLRTM